MNMTIEYRENKMLSDLSAALSPGARQLLHSAAAESVSDQVQKHLRGYVFSKHFTAQNLGATPTGHYEKGAAAISSTATAEAGTVTIPIPGIQRAWYDQIIVPKNAKCLTIPIAGIAYGKRVSELKSLGFKMWSIRSKKGGSILMGLRKGEEEMPLYRLVPVVEQLKDPTLLPSIQEIHDNGANAMIKYIRSVVNKARRRSA